MPAGPPAPQWQDQNLQASPLLPSSYWPGAGSLAATHQVLIFRIKNNFILAAIRSSFQYSSATKSVVQNLKTNRQIAIKRLLKYFVRLTLRVSDFFFSFDKLRTN